MKNTKNTTINPQMPFVVKVDPLVAPLVPEYLRNRAKDLPRLQQALATRDFATLRKLGHNMRGAAGAYGLPPLSEIGARIEDGAQAQNEGSIGAALDDLSLFLQTVKLAP